MYRKELNIGDKFGEWTVIKQLDERKYGYIIYQVMCSCGELQNLSGHYLRDEKSKFCRRCSAKRRIPKGRDHRLYKHGASMIGNPERSTYKVWVSLRQRCNNESCKDYKNYGARGIKTSEDWETFEGFLKDMGVKPDKLSLERIDNNSDYCKENCKWATRLEQNNNKRDNTGFEIEGKRVIRTEIQNKMNWTRDMYRRRQEKYGDDWIIEQYTNQNPI